MSQGVATATQCMELESEGCNSFVLHWVVDVAIACLHYEQCPGLAHLGGLATATSHIHAPATSATHPLRSDANEQRLPSPGAPLWLQSLSQLFGDAPQPSRKSVHICICVLYWSLPGNASTPACYSLHVTRLVIARQARWLLRADRRDLSSCRRRGMEDDGTEISGEGRRA